MHEWIDALNATAHEFAPVHAVNMAMRPAVKMKLTRRTLTLPYKVFMLYSRLLQSGHTVLYCTRLQNRKPVMIIGKQATWDRYIMDIGFNLCL